MENVKKSKPMKFFNPEEIQILTPYITGEKEFNTQTAITLGKQFGRSRSSVYQYVHAKKKSYVKGDVVKQRKPYTRKAVVDKTVTRDKSVVNNTPMFKHGEFIIPVSSWEVRNSNGTTSLVLKFEKSI